MTADFIVDVSEADFEYEVLTYSQQIPVVVDFWAEWCVPCRTLSPLLERLTREAQGAFRLAKVNVDENPSLSLRYAVRSIPVVKAFRNGQMVTEFIGAQPEPRIREFLRSIAPSKNDLALERGASLLGMRQPEKAEKAFRDVLAVTPGYPAALLGLSKSLILQGKISEAHTILTTFPSSREFSSAETLRPLTEALTRLDNGQIFETENPLDAAYYNALRLVKRGNLEAAMDGLLDILRENKKYRNGEARRIIVSLLELLGENDPITRQYRNELSLALF
jgi:putative thioredoxin